MQGVNYFFVVIYQVYEIYFLWQIISFEIVFSLWEVKGVYFVIQCVVEVDVIYFGGYISQEEVIVYWIGVYCWLFFGVFDLGLFFCIN